MTYYPNGTVTYNPAYAMWQYVPASAEYDDEIEYFDTCAAAHTYAQDMERLEDMRTQK